MSSTTVLFVLEEVLRNHTPLPGEVGLMTSFGAGFSAFAGLLEFQ
jgi:predicted naringenin-chalcone synthase